MNPLSASWAQRKEKPAPEKKGEAPFLGVRNEAHKNAGDVVAFEVRGISGFKSGHYKLRYSQGASLKWYLRRLRLLNMASRAAIYDVGVPGRGRLRLRYVPSPSSHVLLMSPGTSPNMHLQRSSVDSQRVVSKMKTNL